MADTQRTLAELIALLPDNTSKQISPQDVRDLVETIRPNVGQIYASAPGVVDILDTADWYDAEATFALAGFSDLFDLQATGRIRYTGRTPRHVLVSMDASISVGGTNQVIHTRFAKTGVAIAESEMDRTFQVSGQVGLMSTHVGVLMSNNDYITVQVRNETSTNDVTFRHINIHTTAYVT